MQVIDFERLQKRLLAAGVSPKFAGRTIIELQDHKQALIEQGRNSGLSESEALKQAAESLGDENAIVREALLRPEILTLSRRYPGIIYTLLPVIGYFMITFPILYLGVEWSREFLNINIEADWPAWHFWFNKVLLYFVEYLLVPIYALLIAIFAIRRNVSMHWPLLGVLIVSFFGSGLETMVEVPYDGGRRGGVGLIWGWTFLPWEVARPAWDQTVEQLLRVAVTIGLMVFVFRKLRPYGSEQLSV